MGNIFERTSRRAVDAADRMTARATRLLRGRGVRRAWLVVACLVALPLLAVGMVQVVSVVAHEEHVERTEVDAADLRGVVVDNGAGSITVVGVEGSDTVSVHARISEGLRSTGHVVSVRDDTLVVRGTCPLFGSEWCSVDYTIEVPADLHVDVDGRQRVTVSDVSGGLVASSDASAVELARVGGDVTVSANQARIDASDLTAARVHARADQGHVTLEFAESPDEVVAEADQGSVDIVLPDEDDVDYATETEANRGTVSDAIRQDPRSARSITVEADQGSITIAYAAS
jgi:hypothetical protein